MATLSGSMHHYLLPFTPTQTHPFNTEVEKAAVFALSEYERNSGRGLLLKQPDEKYLSLTEMGYPFWLLSNGSLAYILDGLSDTPYNIAYSEAPLAKTFLENLQKSASMREGYVTFLSGTANYFMQPPRTKQMVVKGLIADIAFKNEFSIYLNEVSDARNPATLALLTPAFNAATVTSRLNELIQVQTFLREDAARLPECRKQISQTTSQFMEELEFASQATAEEAAAKIKAQEELTKPRVSKLNGLYKRKIKLVEKGYERQILKLRKLKVKTQKNITRDEAKIRHYESQAKIQAAKHHEAYERRWKTKRKKTEKELDGLKHELGKLEKGLENLGKQLVAEKTRLEADLNAQIHLVSQPLRDLEAARDAKLAVFKQETDRLLKLERPIADSVSTSAKAREPILAKFETLGIKNQLPESSALFYIPFYVSCFELGSTKRYLIIPPSIVAGADLSSRLRGVFNISKIGDLLAPRFKAITPFLKRVPWLVKENTSLDRQFKDHMEKSNLLKDKVFLADAQKGLVYLQRDDWLLDKEYELLNTRLVERLSS